MTVIAITIVVATLTMAEWGASIVERFTIGFKMT
jgi:hypothetical protein